ncbi:MAG: GDSL-type esterase/lipase family protein [Gammaproteobacteria bacterium]|nr:GDSL-type esterase/lipase family protein [Gammaproteobacteria bacterium]
MTEATTSKRRQLVFTLITLLLPIAVFVAVEIGLRVGGVATPAPLFITEPRHPDYRLANPNVVQRYFPGNTPAPGIQIETGFFLAEKPANGLRIVVQGGSTAAGFPYGLGASPAGMLERRLRRAYPHRTVEVINTAMSAVNSYTLLDFVDEIITIEPDLVVVYAGHNEYLGLFGVGSRLSVATSPWITRAHLALSQLRIYRALGNVLTPALREEPADRDAARNMMARVAGKRAIPLGSQDFERGVEQFRHNMTAIVDRYRGAGIPVFLGTLVANERDQRPFASSPPQTMELEPGTVDNIAALRATLEQRPDSADTWFALGRALETANQNTAAREAYLQAKDRDQLRFRAPEIFNDILRELADGKSITLVDTQRALAAASPGRIVGSTMMLEHLHPTLDGYFLLADGYFDSIVASGLIGKPSFPDDQTTARAEVPVSSLDKNFGQYKIARLTADWPFVDTPYEPELPPADSYGEELAQALFRQETSWADATLKLSNYYGTRDAAEHLRLSLILADAFPFLPEFQRSASRLLMRAERPREALNHVYRAASREPDHVPTLMLLAEAFARLGMQDEAAQVLDRVTAIDPGNAAAEQAKRLLERDRSS